MGGRRTRGLQDLGLMLLALAISILVWTSYHSEPAAEMTFQAPLEFRNIPRTVELAGDFPPSVRVRVRGRPSALQEATAGQFAVVVDLSGAAAGSSVVHLSPGMIEAPLGTEVVRVTPEEVGVRLNPRSTAR
ncbi:MAG TPA: CdaR family protein [Candidatus Binatia bacterium]|nr:CdaR family protein [Candidatus Binatia bacterium]